LLFFIYVYFFESRLFNELRPIQIKIPPDSPVRLCLKRSRVRLSLLGTWESADFHQGKYTEGSRISQGFVRSNRNAAVERSSVAKGLESMRLKMANYRRSPVVGFPPLGQAARDFLQADAAKIKTHRSDWVRPNVAVQDRLVKGREAPRKRSSAEGVECARRGTSKRVSATRSQGLGLSEREDRACTFGRCGARRTSELHQRLDCDRPRDEW
jgi:hypothetical protein